MPITAVCEHCFEEYQVKSEFAGRLLKCKSCGEQFSVPRSRGNSGRDPSRRSVASGKSRQSNSSSQGRSKSARSKTLLRSKPVLIAGAATLVGALVLTLLLSSSVAIARVVLFCSVITVLICALLVFIGLVWAVIHAFSIGDTFRGIHALRWFPLGPVIHGLQYAKEQPWIIRLQLIPLGVGIVMLSVSNAAKDVVNSEHVAESIARAQDHQAAHEKFVEQSRASAEAHRAAHDKRVQQSRATQTTPVEPAPELDWSLFRSDGDSQYALELPGDSQADSRLVNVEFFSGQSGTLGNDRVSYFIGTQRRKYFDQSADAELEIYAAAYAAERPKLRELGRWPISFGDHDGIALRFFGAGDEDRVRFIRLDNEILMQSVSAEKTPLPWQNFRRFFDSLTVDGQPIHHESGPP